jgi:hypothetical protein
MDYFSRATTTQNGWRGAQIAVFSLTSERLLSVSNYIQILIRSWLADRTVRRRSLQELGAGRGIVTDDHLLATDYYSVEATLWMGLARRLGVDATVESRYVPERVVERTA